MKVFLTILAFLICLQISFAQTENSEKSNKLGIVNGKASYLPKPEYPREARDFCIGGKVEVEVLIGENGDVLEAKAISGDELLRNPAVAAAQKAKFSKTPDLPPIKLRGIVIYNFDYLAKCVTVGIVNQKAVKLDAPQVKDIVNPKNLQLAKEEIIGVQIIVDESGKVTRAKALNGNPLLRAACESAARDTKFQPTLVNGPPVRIKALLVYKIKPDGAVSADIDRNDESVIGTPLSLVRPPPPFCNCRYGGSSSVLVEAKTDEKGNVIEAKALNGHPILKNISEKAALESKFLPTNVEAKILISYFFEAIDKDAREVKIKDIEIKKVSLVKPKS